MKKKLTIAAAIIGVFLLIGPVPAVVCQVIEHNKTKLSPQQRYQVCEQNLRPDAALRLALGESEQDIKELLIASSHPRARLYEQCGLDDVSDITDRQMCAKYVARSRLAREHGSTSADIRQWLADNGHTDEQIEAVFVARCGISVE